MCIYIYIYICISIDLYMCIHGLSMAVPPASAAPAVCLRHTFFIPYIIESVIRELFTACTILYYNTPVFYIYLRTYIFLLHWLELYW